MSTLDLCSLVSRPLCVQVFSSCAFLWTITCWRGETDVPKGGEKQRWRVTSTNLSVEDRLLYIECFGCLSVSSACHPTSLQIMSNIILLWIMYFSSGCCRGDTVWLGPFPPTLNLFPPLFPARHWTSTLVAFPCSLVAVMQPDFYPFPINLHALLCQVTLMTHSFADLRHGERERERDFPVGWITSTRVLSCRSVCNDWN